MTPAEKNAPTEEPTIPFGWQVLAGGVVVVAVVLGSSSLRRPLDTDEVYWIGSAYYFDLAVVRRDFQHRDWRLLPARENPPVGKYLIGLALEMSGSRVESPELIGCFYLNFLRFPGGWGEGVQFEKRAQVASRVSPKVKKLMFDRAWIPLNDVELMAGRRLMLGATLAATLALYWLACRFCRPAGAAVGALLFALQPAVAEASGLARIDSIAVAFSVAAVVGIDQAVRRSFDAAHRVSWIGVVSLGLVIGTFLGLACATKVNASVVAVLLLSLAIYSVARAARLHDRSSVSLAVTTAVALGWALVVFVVINPALYPDIGEGMLALVREHQITASIQQKWQGPVFRSAAERLLPIASLVFVWKPLCLVLGGFVAYKAARGVRGNPTFWVVAAWWLVGILLLACWLPFAIPRYVLPLVPPSALLLGYLVERIVLALARFVRSYVSPMRALSDAA